jgi:hypothetical protein
MLLAFFVQLLAHQLAWLEQFDLRWTQLPQSLLALSRTLDLARSQAEARAWSALLRQQLLIHQRQAKKPQFTRRNRRPLSSLHIASALITPVEICQSILIMVCPSLIAAG